MTSKNNRKIVPPKNRWNVVEYFRQLSVVVVGIVVTFVGSGIITNCSEQRSIKAVMQLVIEELNQNTVHIQDIEERIHDDRVMARYMLDSNFRCESFAKDTLIKYVGLVNNLANYRYTKDALDLLQGSSLMQNINDKNLLLMIIKMYEQFEQTQKKTELYYNIKYNVLNKITMQLNEKERLIVNEGNALNFFKMMMQYDEMRNLCLISSGFIESYYFQELQKDITELTYIIKREYDL